MLIRYLLLAALLFPAASQAGIINFVNAAGTDYRIDSIKSLNVGGAFYDVQYFYDTTWAALGISSGISTQAQATSIANAVRDALNPLNIAAPTGATSFSTDLFHLWSTSGTQVFTVDTYSDGNDPLVYSVLDFNPNDTNYGTRVGWAQVTAAASVLVPAPATLALFGIGLAGLGWSRRKKV